GCRDRVRGLFLAQQTNSTGIHEAEGLSMPFNLRADAVPRHARLVMDNRNTPSGNAVEQSRFPNVRTTHYRDNSWHARNMGQKDVFGNVKARSLRGRNQ